MKLILPGYCGKFRCIADKCSDNCCIGWGIFIDDKTMSTYEKVGGEFGRRLEKSIDRSEQCFVNDSRRRCPFLNENNLCDIIMTLGEECLCDICDRHPRYFEWLDDAIEGGIGLCCEEAARLILSDTEHTVYETEAPERLCGEEADEYDEIFCAFLRRARSKIIALLLDEELPLERALGRLAAYAEVLQDRIDEYDIETLPEIGSEERGSDVSDIAAVMRRAEAADAEQARYTGVFCELVQSVGGFADILPKNERELRNIAVYFVRRYMIQAVYSGNLYPKLMLTVFAVKAVSAMFRFDNAVDFEQKCRTARLFSKLIEYNEDNLRLVYDLYDY